MSRGRFLKVRVSDAELADIRARASEADMTVSDFMRFRMINFRLRQTRSDKERLRQLARIGSNVNQLARWANINKAAGPTLEVLLWLNRLTLAAAGMTRSKASGKSSEDAEGNDHAD